MAIQYSAGALASAAVSLAAGLVQQLIAKDLLTKEDALDLYEGLAAAKEATSKLSDNDDDKEAGKLLRYLAERLRERP